jgi:hypothetical protein
MNNLYCKVAVASICTALSFTLITNKEAKAATFNLTATKFFIQGQTNVFGNSDIVFDNESSNEVSIIINDDATKPEGFYRYERRGFYEFNIGNLSLTTNTVISRAVLDIPIRNRSSHTDWLLLNLSGYVGNGKPDLSDFEAGAFLGSTNLWYSFIDPINNNFNLANNLNWDVTNFVNQRVSNRDAFAGFGIRAEILRVLDRNSGRFTLDYGYEPTLKIETVDVPEPVPEPITIFSSALALGVGGWLKRKKSSQQNKTTSQH